MLIGNQERLAFEIVPVAPGWERRYEPEAACWAGLAVWVAGKNLCANVRIGGDEIRHYLYVPLGPLADWLVRSYPGFAFEERAPFWSSGGRLHDAVHLWGERPPPAGMDEDQWLDAREAFWERHFVAAGAEGSRLPNLALLRQDDEALLFWAPPKFAVKAPLVFLHPLGQATLSWGDVEQPIRAFIAFTAEAFKAAGHTSAFPWLVADLPNLLSPPPGGALGLYCARPVGEIAKLLGVDQAQLAEALRLSPSADPSTSPVCQTLRDLSPFPASGIGAEILATVDQGSSAQGVARGDWRKAREKALDHASSGSTPQEQGQLAARGLREALGLDSEPIANVAEVAERFGTAMRATTVAATNERMLVAAPKGGAPVVTILRTGRTATPWGQRFEQARGLGHAVLDPLSDDAFGAASSSYAQQRRRMRSGAFAAELLLPIVAVEKASSGHLDGATQNGAFAKVLERYIVGARTAAHQFYNHGWLSSPSVRDELIDEHSSAK